MLPPCRLPVLCGACLGMGCEPRAYPFSLIGRAEPYCDSGLVGSGGSGGGPSFRGVVGPRVLKGLGGGSGGCWLPKGWVGSAF